jgi:hypothetical protein
MKQARFIILLFGFVLPLVGQEARTPLTGVVSYVSSRNVYVKFRTTKLINLNDTLFCSDGSRCLIVQKKSSISCISLALDGKTLVIGDSLTAYVIDTTLPKIEAEKPKDVVRPPETEPDAQPIAPKIIATKTPKPRGPRVRVSAASYNNYSEIQPTSTWRLTYQASGNLKQKPAISLDHYVVYRRSYDAQDTFLNRFNNAFKVYSLAVQYAFKKDQARISFGRKINQRFASVGALDGLQFERMYGKHISAGALLGSRPRLQDYSIDFNLLQGGLFVGYGAPESQRQATLGIMEQRNGAATDRRFTYAQYSDVIGKNLQLFGSAEADFYANVRDTVSYQPQLTNLYLSADPHAGHNHGTAAPTATGDLDMSPPKSVERAAGAIAIGDLIKNKAKYSGKTVKLTGKVMKVNQMIMNRNWLHLQDGTGNNFDLVLTSAESIPPGHTVTLEGVVALDKDFGAGYRYDIIVENATLVK